VTSRSSKRGKLLWALCVLLSMLSLSACGSGLVPRTPRVARAPGYELSLGEVRGGSGIRIDEDRRLQVHVAAIPARTRVLEAAVQEAGRPPCSGGVAASRVRVVGEDEWTNKRRPRPGETLSIELSGAAWKFATEVASRLDLALRDSAGALRCITFPLVDAAPQNRWDLLDSWTVSGLFELDFFLDGVDGIDDAAVLGLSLGKWLGPVRVGAGAGGGASSCSKSVCAPSEETGSSRHHYVPLFAGADSTLFQAGWLAFGFGVQYRVIWTGTETYAGERSVFLHGPALRPRLSWALPDPIAPGIPGGPRRGYAISLDVPLGYVMSARGDASFSVGGGLVFSFPVH
jgi:hypothetical protein